MVHFFQKFGIIILNALLGLFGKNINSFGKQPEPEPEPIEEPENIFEKRFEREDRYIVIKRSDLMNTPNINQGMLFSLMKVLEEVEAHRAAVGKQPFECVVVEADWPEYESTWDMIEKRMQYDELVRSVEAEANSEIAEISQKAKDSYPSDQIRNAIADIVATPIPKPKRKYMRKSTKEKS